MTSCANWVYLNLSYLKALSQITIPECFSNLSHGKISICMEIIHVLSQFMFDGEGGTNVSKHINDFIRFCKYHEIYDKDIACMLFTLTLEGHVNWWCHTLPSASIHSFQQFHKELHQCFDRYDYQYVYKKMNHLRMEPNESVGDFSDRFIHLCYGFPEEYMDWDFFK